MASTLRDEISRLELLHAAHPDGLVFPHLADAYRRAGRYTQAENLLDAGLRRHAEYSSAHVVLGRLRLDQGKREDAEAAFRRVLQLDPQNQVALQYLAELAVDRGRLQEALGLFRRLTRVKSDDALAERVRELESRIAAGEGSAPRPGPAAVANGGARPTNGHGNALSGAAAVPARRPPAAGPSDPPAVPEPGEVVTETMAELYARQGLHHRAVAVYRQLLERSPEDSRLRAKLQSAQAALNPGGAQPPGGSPPASAAAPEPATAQAGTASPARPSIRDDLRGLLAWRADASPAGEARGPEAAGPAAADVPTPPPAVPDPEPVSAPAPVEAPPERAAGSAPEPAAVATPEPAAVATPEPVAAAAPEPAPVAAPDLAPREPTRAPTASHAEGGEDPLSNAAPQTRSLIALTDMLVGLLEYRDPFFRGSSSLTRLLATSVAEEMGLGVEERVDLALAAVLRDLGRLALGGKLLPNPQKQQTQEARRRIERHVDLALHLMEGIELPRNVRLAVRHHHERWDGAGYPDALTGGKIPLLARILAVVDSFAAMVSPRPYRLPRKVPEAAAELQQEAGTRYDPEVVNALVRVLARREQPHLGFVQRHHVLMVNPDHPGAVVTAAKLCSAGYLAEVAVDPATARERLRRVPVAALVVSAECGADATAALLRELRVDPLFASLPIVVSDAAGVALRVRLLESGADVCFPPGVRHAELQGTLGALVRRTMRPRGADGDKAAAEAPWLALQGDIRDFPLTWLLQVMKYDSRTAAVGIRGARGEGVIYLQTGDATHAQIRGGASGEAALREMLQWEKGRFTVQPDARPKERTITTSIMHLLLTQAVDQDHAAAGIFGAVSEGG